MKDTASLAEHVALVVLDTYHTLANSGKPSVRPNGIPEWTVLAGLIAQRKGRYAHRKTYSEHILLTNKHRWVTALSKFSHWGKMFAKKQGSPSAGSGPTRLPR